MNIKDSSPKLVKEVEYTFLDFRITMDRIFKGEDCINEISDYHHPLFVNRYSNVKVKSQSIENSRQEQLASFIEMAKLYKKYGGAAMTIPWYKILLRSDTEALISFEICQVGPYFWDRSFVIQVWKQTAEGKWKILRQLNEQEGRHFPSTEQLDFKENYDEKNELMKKINSTLEKVKKEYLKKYSINKKHNFYRIFIDYKYIEMLNKHKGLVCYKITIFNELEERIILNQVKNEIWQKDSNNWFLSKVIQ